jgi:SAM-dependent methyltransferase
MPDLRSLKYLAKKVLRRRGKVAFLQQVPKGGTILDVGCGSNSPARAKHQRPDIHYIGLDVGDYNHSTPPGLHADHYIVVPPDHFAAEIENLAGQCDAIISSHNLEHCLDPDRVLRAISMALKPGGRLYLSFPCEESVNFPRREGTLNFYDDPTHSQVPNYRRVLVTLGANNIKIAYARKRHRPALLFLAGLFLEPVSMLTRRTMPGLSTWALYGFESVIWAERA